MPTYLISPPDRTDWHEDSEQFVAALEARWPDATITQRPPDDPMALSVELVQDDEHVLGDLHRDGQALSVHADVAAAAAIAAWWRQRVPDEVELVFYDEAYNADVAVSPGVDADTLASAYLAAANA